MNCYQAALLVALLGFVGSVPLFEKRVMDINTIEQANSFISKILEDIPKAHASWIKSPSLKMGSSVNLELQHLKENLIPSAPVLEIISENFTTEVCLDHIFKGLELHQNLLEEIQRFSKLKETEQVAELKADIRDLKSCVKKLQSEAGFEPSKHSSEHDLAEKLKSEFMMEVAAHLTLQQLQMFGCDVQRSIRTFLEMTSGPTSSEDSEHTDNQCVTLK